MSAEQPEFDFSTPRTTLWDGINHMELEIRNEKLKLAAKLGLPIEQKVEVTLTDGRSLKGKLLLHERNLFIPKKRASDLMLEIGSTAFRACDIDSCLKLDDSL